MNEFQTQCWYRCKRILEREQISFVGPIQVNGKRESYFIVQFSLRKDIIELFIYVDEAGVMINGKNWKIFEVPDFDCGEALTDAYEKYIRELLSVG